MRQQIAEDIKQHLFCNVGVNDLEELAKASDQLEILIEKMMNVSQGPAMAVKQSKFQVENGWKVDDDDSGLVWGGDLDTRFAHSWTPSGPGLGWYWIPKGCLDLNEKYPARWWDVRRFGHSARRVRVLPRPPPLSRSFVSVVSREKMAGYQPRPLGKRR